MLQRRIGMMWTRSGCEVSDNPRAKCLTARRLRLRSASSDIQPFSISDRFSLLGRCRWPARSAPRQSIAHGLHGGTDANRRVEQVFDAKGTGKLVASERGQARRRDAAAVLAIRLSAELARRDLRLEIS